MPLILVDLLKKTDYNNKITAIEGETPDMTSLATATGFNDVKNSQC